MPGMRGLPCRCRHAHFLKWIKKLDRQLELFVEELAHVGDACGAATKEDARRTLTLLLCTIMVDGTHQLGVQPSHGAADYLRDAANVWVSSVSTATESDEAVPFPSSFRSGEGFVK